MPGGTNAGNTGDSGSTVGGYGSTVGNGAATGGLNPANAGSAANPMVPGQNTAAQNMLQNLLGTPRPNGAPPGIGQGQGTVIGGGMAGVASKMDAEGLMVYNDRTNYKEWEFVYDPSKDRPRPDPRNMMVGNQMGTPSTPTPGSATPSSQPGMFSQPGQSGMSGQVVTNAPGGTSGTSGLTGSNGQTGTPTSAANSGQGAPIDIRPGKK
jgi:hypothetical protein